MFGLMLFLCTPCLFVCIAMSSSEVTSHRRPTWWSTWKFELQASCSLDHSYLPNNVSVNHCDMLRLIWWDLIGFPRFVYPTPYLPLNIWVVLLLLYLVFGNYCYIMIMFQLCWFLIIIHEKIIINWNMELNLRYPCYHKGGIGRPWLTN
jgi:hypothetical protein